MEEPSYFTYGVGEGEGGYSMFDGPHEGSIGEYGLAQGCPSPDQAERPSVPSPPSLESPSSATPDTTASTQAITPDMLVAPKQEPKPSADDIVFHPSAPVIPPPPREAKPRTIKPRPEGSPDHGDAKRAEYLERNRIAASKCRQRRKAWEAELEETSSQLERQNSDLRIEYDNLMDEIGRTRALLMAHVSCQDAGIDKWVEAEAKRFIMGDEGYDDTPLAEPVASEVAP